jgi:hypothetical protein
MPVFVTLAADDFDEGVRTVKVTVTDGAAYTGTFEYRLAGPMHDADDRHERRDRDKDHK